MKFYHQLPLFVISLFLTLSSCANEKQEGDNVATDSIVVTDKIATPTVSEIVLKGKWESKDNPLYPILEFKGKSTVVIKTIMGSFASSYERDEEFIRVRTDKSDLLFEIVSEDSIKGSGFAKGIWIKNKND